MLGAVGALVASVAVVVVAPPLAFAGDTSICYVVADSGGGNGGNDLLFSVDKITGARVTIGTGTGTNSIEAAEYDPYTDRLLAANANRLGTINQTTGVWSALGPVVRHGQRLDRRTGVHRCRQPRDGPVRRRAVRGPPSRRRGDLDALFRIDPTTGVFVPGVFAAGPTTCSCRRRPAWRTSTI